MENNITWWIIKKKYMLKLFNIYSAKNKFLIRVKLISINSVWAYDSIINDIELLWALLALDNH